MRARAYTLATLLLVMIANGLQASEESPSITITSLSEGDWVEGEVEILVDGDVDNLELLANGTVVASANAGESLIWDTRDENATSPELFQVVVRGELENGTEVESSPVNVTVLYPRQLTYDTAMDIQPEWHPDGEIFVFKSNRGEEDHIFKLYGEEAKQPGSHAANCLMARRLAERGVRFIQVFHRGWDGKKREHLAMLPN